MLQEVFALNSSAYQQNSFAPNARYGVTETGALREQHYVTLEMNPIRFNQVTGQLEVVTEMEVTLTFNNPTTTVNANTGIFNKVATSAFINYEDSGMSTLVNDSAFEKAGFVPGTVTWITLTDTAQAQHTGDGHLGFVLLVGDEDDNIAVSIPVATNHGIAYGNQSNCPQCLYRSYYYYSCITKTNGVYDHDGDLYIGRFSVQTPTQLFNMVEKTINHETLYSADNAWCKTTGTTIAEAVGANYCT